MLTATTRRWTTRGIAPARAWGGVDDIAINHDALDDTVVRDAVVLRCSTPAFACPG
jgi:hypothetical protein